MSTTSMAHQTNTIVYVNNEPRIEDSPAPFNTTGGPPSMTTALTSPTAALVLPLFPSTMMSPTTTTAPTPALVPNIFNFQLSDAELAGNFSSAPPLPPHQTLPSHKRPHPSDRRAPSAASSKKAKTAAAPSRRGGRRPKFSLGTLVAKDFGGKTYRGKIVSFASPYYKVKYDDRDEEEWTIKEVESGIDSVLNTSPEAKKATSNYSND
mmetsp:Transcript_17839/g.36217  ORF Transcript_17839/g.36217 Transcript_17839/m.36217 type:complete len:208 (+) Transcript_17839:593-1216(+)